jgi:hypothetical protein
MNKTVITLISIIVISRACAFSQNVEVTKIWDKAQHNAFTDLVRYKSDFYCTFREGNNHVPETKSDYQI